MKEHVKRMKDYVKVLKKDIYIEEIFHFFQDKIQRNARLSSKAKEKITSRLKQFSVEELKESILLHLCFPP